MDCSEVTGSAPLEAHQLLERTASELFSQLPSQSSAEPPVKSVSQSFKSKKSSLLASIQSNQTKYEPMPMRQYQESIVDIAEKRNTLGKIYWLRDRELYI